MKINSYQFKWLYTIEPKRDSNNGQIKQFMPQSRYRNIKKLPLNKYGEGPFCRFKIPNNYNVSGVYAISVENKIKYIGECLNLSSRYNMGYGIISPRNCFSDGQETNCRINNLIYKTANSGSRISLWFLQTENYKAIESKIRESEQFEWNRI